MKNILFAFIFSAFVISSFEGYSQNKKFKGYIISLSGDSVEVYFKKNYWYLAPRKIEAILNHQNVSYSPADIKGFGIIGSEAYQAVTVRYFKDLYGGDNLKYEFTESKTEERVFVKILQSGVVNLFLFQTGERKYYFISEGNGELTELVFRARLQGTVVIEDDTYIEQLTQLFQKYNNTQEEKLKKISYNEESIGRIVEKINQTKEPGFMTNKKKNRFDFEIGAAFIYNSFPSSFSNLRPPSVKLSSIITFSPQLNLTYKFKNNMGRFQIGLSMQYNFVNSKQSIYDSAFVTVSPNFYYNEINKHEYQIPSGYYMMNLYLLGYINRFSKFKLYLKAGASFNGFTGDAALKSDYSYIQNGIRNGNVPFTFTLVNKNNVFDFQQLWAQPNAGIGFTHLRHAFELQYYLPVRIDRNLSNENKFIISSLQGTYRFRISKSRL